MHPGAILVDEFLRPLSISNERLAEKASICLNELNELILGNKHITDDIAVKLADFFGTTPQFWLGLQSNYDSEYIK